MRWTHLAVAVTFYTSSFAATDALAGGPTTRPIVLAPTATAEPRERPAMIDTRGPAFVPKFAKANNPPAGQFAERQYADRYTYPAFCGYGYSGCGYAHGGYFGGAAWGGGFTAWH